MSPSTDVWVNFTGGDFELPEDLLESNEDDIKTPVGILVLFFAICGIFANMLVLTLSLGRVKGDFRHYVANLAIVDVLCGVLFAFMGLINIKHMSRQFSVSVMTYSALMFYGSFGIMIWALVPISVSRYLALTQQKIYAKALTGRQSLVFCLLADTVPVLLLYIICVVSLETSRWLLYAYAIATATAYVIAFASNYKVFIIVSHHIAVVQNLRDQARLLETRQVAVATLAQALVPLVCQVPAFLTLWSMPLRIQMITNEMIIRITQLWLASSPLLDAVITVLVIKQYRRQAFTCLSSVGPPQQENKKKSNTVYSDEREPFETSQL